MERDIKKWIEREYLNTKIYGDGLSTRHAIDRCYGAFMFVINEILDYDSEESQRLIFWWENEMLPKFNLLLD